MDLADVNVLVSTFPGLSLPPTLCLPIARSETTNDLLQKLAIQLTYLPVGTRLTLTTHSRQQIKPSAQPQALGSLLPPECNILPLRLSLPLVGGKGGFGSQLRAAGGRMSSRKKKQNAALATGSARNLDGRRLRTIAEAKNLAAYLATKPDADAKERDEKRRRWEQIVEMAEVREAEMRSGKDKDGRKRGLGDEWMEVKEEVGEGVKNAVRLAMQADQDRESEGSEGASGASGASGEGSGSDSEAGAEEDVMELDEEGMEKLRVEAEAGDEDAIWVLKERLRIPERYLPKPKPIPTKRVFAGFDDDDEDDVSSSDDDHETIEDTTKSKGKARAE